MEIIASTFTEDDVWAAFYARQVRNEIRVEHHGEATPAQIITSDAHDDAKDPESKASRLAYIREHTALYERGAEILKTAKLVISERSIVPPGELIEGRMRARWRIVSPFATLDSGHIATSEAWRIMALAERGYHEAEADAETEGEGE